MTIEKLNKRVGIYFFLPSRIVVIGIIVYPLLFSLVTSFTSYGFLNPFFNQFVWFENYSTIFHDIYFWNSLWVIFKFVVVVVTLEFFLGFSIALLLNRKIKGKGIFYTILTIPILDGSLNRLTGCRLQF
jgi:multiple sugar transport system permease protein